MKGRGGALLTGCGNTPGKAPVFPQEFLRPEHAIYYLAHRPAPPGAASYIRSNTPRLTGGIFRAGRNPHSQHNFPVGHIVPYKQNFVCVKLKQAENLREKRALIRHPLPHMPYTQVAGTAIDQRRGTACYYTKYESSAHRACYSVAVLRGKSLSFYSRRITKEAGICQDTVYIKQDSTNTPQFFI
jgi:hypothetical protein